VALFPLSAEFVIVSPISMQSAKLAFSIANYCCPNWFFWCHTRILSSGIHFQNDSFMLSAFKALILFWLWIPDREFRE
jgi:hypothetical protein